MAYKAHPDGPYAVDLDRGPGSVAAKEAQLLDLPVHQDRVNTRDGLRDLDSMTEGMSGLNRLQKDRERLIPRETNADLGHPRMRRRLPAAGDVRTPLSARQRNERSKDRLTTQRTIPLTQLRAQRDLVTREERWAEINNQLSANVGDVQALSDADQEQVRRIDRAIQAYERRNDRGHVVYSNVQMPPYINRQNVEGFLRNNFEVGDQITFDRYTIATHQLHETASYMDNPRGNVVVLEIETRRGAYLGHSDKMDNTAHLLPRGPEFEVAGIQEAAYRTPDGRSGSRWVIQLRDVSQRPDSSTARLETR